MINQLTRCIWCSSDELYIKYHDSEWGNPVREDKKLFEFILLEGAQAGLNWLTILKKRENYREAFAGFDVQKVADFTQEDISRLLLNPGIIRNKAKIISAIKNARSFKSVQEEFGSFSSYIWNFMPEGQPILNSWNIPAEVPVSTELSALISKDLIKRGFSFLGPVICYAFMQATGMVDDHLLSCYRNKLIKEV